MGLRSRLSVYCCVAPTSGFYAPSVLEIGDYVSNLSFSSAAPGGYASISATLSLHDARIPRPEFALFSLINVFSGSKPVWLGEITDPTMGMDANLGEYVRISGLGLGNALRDDPRPVAYTNQTAKQIATAEVNARMNSTNKIEMISGDTGLLFPDNPATLFSPVYDNRTMEEVIADVCLLAGDYQWGVWAHPLEKNSLSFPLGQVSVQKRDTATTHYIASVAEQDVVAYTVTPSAERAYNYVAVDYTQASGAVGTALSGDPRLDGTFAQSKAPFRYRRLVRDYSGTATIGSTQAQAIASTYGGQYRNVSNKVSLTLQSVKDASGNPIPLWEVMADHNIFIRDFAPRGNAPLPTAPTAGVNQFYIVNAEYREDDHGTQQLFLQCDNFVDRAASQIARLTLAADVKSRTGKTTGATQIQGAPANGAAIMGQSNALAGQNCTGPIYFANALYQPPTSIAFTQIVNVNLGAPSAANLGVLGAIVQASVVANGATQGYWTYVTSGNCIRRVGKTLFDWHCDGCDKEFRGLRLNEHVRVETGLGMEPGSVALAVDCPECAVAGRAHTESFNTALTSRDEEDPRGVHGGHHHRREQARLIRALMRSGAVGLEVLP